MVFREKALGIALAGAGLAALLSFSCLDKPALEYREQSYFGGQRVIRCLKIYADGRSEFGIKSSYKLVFFDSQTYFTRGEKSEKKDDFIRRSLFTLNPNSYLENGLFPIIPTVYRRDDTNGVMPPEAFIGLECLSGYMKERALQKLRDSKF